MEKYPWSAKQLRLLGESIRDEIPKPEKAPEYDEVMLYFNDYANSVQEQIDRLDWGSLLGNRKYEVTSRPKTIDTLRQKLQRDRNTPLSSVQDVAGVRFEADMTLDEQDVVVNALQAMFEETGTVIKRDLRDGQHSGYRAVHLWLRDPARAEIQIRTHLQGKWANMYEAAADLLGRDIRYGSMPENAAAQKLVRIMLDFSKSVADFEIRYNKFIRQDLVLKSLQKFEMRRVRMKKSDVRRWVRRGVRIKENDLLLENWKAELESTRDVIGQSIDDITARFQSLSKGSA